MKEILERRIDALIEEQYKDQGAESIINNLEAVITQIVSENLLNKKKVDPKAIVKMLEGMIEELPIGDEVKKAVVEALPGKVKLVLKELNES